MRSEIFSLRAWYRRRRWQPDREPSVPRMRTEYPSWELPASCWARRRLRPGGGRSGPLPGRWCWRGRGSGRRWGSAPERLKIRLSATTSSPAWGCSWSTKELAWQGGCKENIFPGERWGGGRPEECWGGPGGGSKEWSQGRQCTRWWRCPTVGPHTPPYCLSSQVTVNTEHCAWCHN